MAITPKSKIVIGLVSPISAGKGTVIAFLRKRGFFCLSLSDRIREEVTARGQEITRERLLTVANQLRQDYGSEVLAWRTWQIAQKQRFLWARKRAREGEPLTWEEFVQIDKRDFFSGDGQVGRNIPACLDKADFLIDNNGTIKQLENKVVMVLEEIFTNG